MNDTVKFLPGGRISHPDFGAGVILDAASDGYLRAFFSVGERRVPVSSIQSEVSRTESILRNVGTNKSRARNIWLSHEANSLPVMESASALTSARIDLLPHQVVLTHRIATASPRRYLIADEVGLGKTIETALVLRELASRGELNRALMVVPAGLVNNWHHELNDVFNLNFEVFGSEGDITDRKTNAFAKHDRLIASIDTLKRPSRIKKLLAADPWDLVVFDEAHHLTAHKNGGKIRKTENYKLGEALKSHARDLLLLSATPHQGNHFRFWMIIQLLDSTLFGNPEDMVHNRHRLNTVMFRRTKADACKPDGEPLFARRGVHTEAFLMNEEEKRFYEALRDYLRDGFDLAKRQGNQGRALGFLMAIFQKIAASSFAAVRRTLKRRMLMLTLHEAHLRDRELDIETRERLYDEAREIIHAEWKLPKDIMGRSETDRIISDLKYKLLKKLDEEALEMASDNDSHEFSASIIEDSVSDVVDLHLPEERLRIADLLAQFPRERETKVQKLLDGIGALWRQNSQEKIVIFATYLGTVDLISREIEEQYPGQGVAILKGGDHGAKSAAEKRFKLKDGPRVLICTAAGREGINLQFARVLFNFDLPWNPMDMEQRIGRIHRYGQAHTAQVYNLVLSDTIEGKIFLLLDDKLTEIARTLGKVDDQGNIAEDLRAQILGQLSEKLNYDKLYQDALSDPLLERTSVELEAALSNAREAREVVFDLFQDLDGFSLDDYQPLSDVSTGLKRILEFMSLSVFDKGQSLKKKDDQTYLLEGLENGKAITFTLDRETASDTETVDLLGIDHPIVQAELSRWQNIAPERIGLSVKSSDDQSAFLCFWRVESSGKGGERRTSVQTIAVKKDGTRLPAVERNAQYYINLPPSKSSLTDEERISIFSDIIEPTLLRELRHKGAADDEGSYSAELIGYVEIL